jgi:hypothetical protein
MAEAVRDRGVPVTAGWFVVNVRDAPAAPPYEVDGPTSGRFSSRRGRGCTH